MSALVNNCTVFLEEANHGAGHPSLRPVFRTETAESIEGQQDRLGLRSAPFVRQKWNVEVDAAADRQEIEGRIRETLRSGRMGAPRWDRALPVTANSGTSLTVTSEWPLAIGDFLAVPTSAGLVAREIDGAVESPAGTFTLTLDATMTAQVGMLAYPLLFGTPTIERLGSINPDKLAFELVLTEPLGTGALITSDSCTPEALEAETVVGFCQNDVAVDDPVSCSGTNVASLTVDPISQADDYTVEVATAAAGTYSTHATGVASTLDVPRSQTALFYRFVPQINGASGPASTVAETPATTIEGVMRAVQERYLAVESPGTAIVWPVRISDSTSPGDYPADDFYNDKATGTRFVTYVQAIADAFNAPPVAWLDKYASQTSLTGVANIAAIPLHTVLTLGVPVTASIGTANQESSLFALAGCCCQLENLVYSTTQVNLQTRTGAGYGKHYEMVSEQTETTGFGTYAAAASAAWNSVDWGADGSVEVPSSITGTAAGGGAYPAAIGLLVAANTASATAYCVSYNAYKAAQRGSLEIDLAADIRGTPQIYLRITGGTTDDALPRPVTTFDTLQPWRVATPGSLVTEGPLANDEPVFPAGFGAQETRPNDHHFNPTYYLALTDLSQTWLLDESVVLWFRSHRRSVGAWDHYP
jgi:hypothetical protein